MALPYYIEKAFNKTRQTADLLSRKCYELEQAKNSRDEGRIKRAQEVVTKETANLASAAKELVSAVR